MFITIFPNFKYHYSVDVEKPLEAIGVMQERLAKKGAIFEESHDGSVIALISASKLAFAMSIIPNKLLIRIKPVVGKDRVYIEVERTSEKKFALGLFIIALAVVLFDLANRQSPKVLMIPLAMFLAIWVNSLLPFHPAHKKLQDLLRYPED